MDGSARHVMGGGQKRVGICGGVEDGFVEMDGVAGQ